MNLQQDGVRDKLDTEHSCSRNLFYRTKPYGIQSCYTEKKTSSYTGQDKKSFSIAMSTSEKQAGATESGKKSSHKSHKTLNEIPYFSFIKVFLARELWVKLIHGTKMSGKKLKNVVFILFLILQFDNWIYDVHFVRLNKSWRFEYE